MLSSSRNEEARSVKFLLVIYNCLEQVIHFSQCIIRLSISMHYPASQTRRSSDYMIMNYNTNTFFLFGLSTLTLPLRTSTTSLKIASPVLYMSGLLYRLGRFMVPLT